jgi:WD40 repeat protein
MKIPACVFVWVIIISGALAQGPTAPHISDTYPPAEDIRKPDLTIPGNDPSGSGVIAYNPNGRFLAVAAGDKAIRIYDARPGDRLTAELAKTLTGHAAQILGLCFSDTNTLVSISLDQTAKVWDVESGKLLHTAELALGKQVRFAIAPGHPSLAADSSFGKARLWNYQTGELLKTFEPNDSWVSALAFTPDGKLLVIGTDKGVVRVMDVAEWKVMRTIDLDSPVRSLAAGANRILVGYGDGTVAMLNLGDQASVPEVRKQSGAINGVAFSPKGDQFASASADKTVKVWDTETLKLLCSQEGHGAGVLSVAFSPNGQKMASIDADGHVNYWTVPLAPIPPADLEKINAALPLKATATPKKPRRILVFWRADAILHKGGVPAANKAIALMGERTGAYHADFSRDYEVFDPKVLGKYDAIVMNSTAHLAIPDYAKKAYLDFAKNGGGVIGIHAAIDTFRDWPEGAKVIGATFGNHPWGPSGTWAVKLEEPEHPLLRAFGGKNFKLRDEFYEMWDPYTPTDRRVLLRVDLSDAATAAVKTRRQDKDFALAWVKRYEKGRVFYCDFGHIAEPFENSAVLQFYLDGIQYALGDLQVEDEPKPRK